MSVPEGWLSIQDAATFAGITEAEVKRRASRIRKDAQYTNMGPTLASLQRIHRSGAIIGLSPQTPESLPIVPGSELKSLHEGRLILNAEMVRYWKAVQDKLRELKQAGYKTVDEAAEELGISVKDVKLALRELHKSRRGPKQGAER
ncbi:MAG: hypothetical protein HY040_07535 [Planctomycetes bacterium]|nr:hypothetical protein [Planctomycetota bacterium]